MVTSWELATPVVPPVRRGRAKIALFTQCIWLDYKQDISYF